MVKWLNDRVMSREAGKQTQVFLNPKVILFPLHYFHLCGFLKVWLIEL